MYEHYQVLGVKKDANNDDLKKAYRALAKKYHPDLHPNDPAAHEKSRQINEAYDILSDPEKRKKYDAEQAKAEARADVGTKKKTTTYSPRGEKPDFSNMNREFERFFGFQPENGEITNEEKLKQKNPLDASSIFEKFFKP